MKRIVALAVFSLIATAAHADVDVVVINNTLSTFTITDDLAANHGTIAAMQANNLGSFPPSRFFYANSDTYTAPLLPWVISTDKQAGVNNVVFLNIKDSIQGFGQRPGLIAEANRNAWAWAVVLMGFATGIVFGLTSRLLRVTHVH